jgi:hypothetical protein
MARIAIPGASGPATQTSAKSATSTRNPPQTSRPGSIRRASGPVRSDPVSPATGRTGEATARRGTRAGR